MELTVVDARESRDFAARLNRRDTDALAAMWEVMLLSGFSGLGDVQHHRRTPNGKHPDLLFRHKLVTFTADISSVSSDGIEEQNPYRRFQDEIEKQKRKLGLGIGGVYLQVGHYEGERKVKLKLPPSKDIPAFVRKNVMPAVKVELRKRTWPVFIRWREEDIEFDLTIKDGPYSGGGFRSYDVPKTVKSNPIYSRLRKKAAQVAKGEGLRGLILCDAGYSAFTKPVIGGNRIDGPEISKAFLRQTDEVDFVALIWVAQNSNWTRDIRRDLRCDIIQKSPDPALSAFFDKCLEQMPEPRRTGANALNHIRWEGRDLGFGGGYSMSWPTIKLSSKMLMNLLSGRISVDEFNELMDWHSVDGEHRRRLVNLFEKALQEGRLPEIVTIDRSPDEDDDHITIKFSKPDAAAHPFEGRSD